MLQHCLIVGRLCSCFRRTEGIRLCTLLQPLHKEKQLVAMLWHLGLQVS